MSRSTLSPFDVAIAQADKVISDVMMSVYVINGKKYKAVLDEEPRVMGGGGDDYLINGTTRTLVLFKSSGYKPKLGDVITASNAKYVVRGFSFEDGKIVLQLE
nr:MAG TPA: ATP-binding sugar transporter [Bacteriophage sp.]